MQKVRSSIIATLSLAALAACGDKVEIVQPTPTTPVVREINLSNTAPTVGVGQTIAIAANVVADAGFTGDRGVNWTVSGAAVTTVSSDANSITLRGASAGSAVVTATSKADAGLTARSTVTVTAGPTTPTAPASIVITQIEQGQGTVSSVPGVASNVACAPAAPGQTVDITNACGQINVGVTYDPGSSTATKVELIVTPTGGTAFVCDTRNIGNSASIDASAAPTFVQLSCNTAQATAAGVTQFKNGTYTLSARLTTSSGGTTSATQATTTITLNNADFLATQIVTAGVNSAADAQGQVWIGGPTTTFPSLTVTVTPVFYTSGRTLGNGTNTVTVRLADNTTNATIGTASNTITTASGQFSTTFLNTTSATTDQIPTTTNGNVVARVSGVDNTGNPLPNGGMMMAGAAQSQVVRLDTQGPPVAAATYNFTAQGGSNGWVNGSQTFNTTAAGGFTADPATAGDNGGVDRVTTTFQWANAPLAATPTWNTFTSASDAALAESNTSTAYALRAVATDALGNVSNTASLGTFGVDRTAPSATVVASPSLTSPEIVGIGQTLSTTTFQVGASDPQGGNGATGSGFSTTPLMVSVRRIAPSGATGQVTTCAGFGVQTGTAPNTVCNSQSAAAQSITLPTAVGEYLVTYRVVDQAGNATTNSTFQYYIDNVNAPTLSGGMQVPASIGEGTAFSVGAADDMDVAAGNARVDYPYGIQLFFAGSASPAGVAFDGTLTRTSTVSASLNDFYRSLTEISGGAFTAGGGKPTTIALRSVDAAGNLSLGNSDNIPANNVSGTGANPYVISNTGAANELQNFTVTSSAATVKNSTANVNTTTPQTTNLTARVSASNFTTTSPFTRVCFYYQTNTGTEGGLGGINGSATGEWVQIGCTSTVVTTTDIANNRFFDYTLTAFNPDNRLGTAGTLNIRAIGSNANRDGLMTAAAGINLVP